MLSQLAGPPGAAEGLTACRWAERAVCRGRSAGEPNTSGHTPSRCTAGEKAAHDNGGSLPLRRRSALRNGAGAPTSERKA